MKYVFIFSLIFYIQCANAKEEIKLLESSSVDFDVSAGRYDQFKLNNWKVGSNECVEFTLYKPYNTTNFLAALIIFVNGDSKSHKSRIILYTEHADSKSLTLAYLSSDKEYRLIKNNISFGEPVKFSLKFVSNRTIEIKSAYSEFSIPLQFKITNVLLGATSSQSTAKIVESSDCNSQK
jgi:hypothetical protein